MIVNQWVPAAHKGDAIGDSARRVRGLLREMGHQSDLFALTIDEELVEAVHSYEDQERVGRGPLSLGDVLAVADIVASLREKPDLLLMQEATEHMDALPELAGGHFHRLIWPGRIHGLAAWSRHRLGAPHVLPLPASRLPGRLPRPGTAEVIAGHKAEKDWVTKKSTSTYQKSSWPSPDVDLADDSNAQGTCERCHEPHLHSVDCKLRTMRNVCSIRTKFEPE